ncbi:peptide/nickel transport system permease protein [Antricoccus suffuscus]|uniref:Peptide/nickel transport system permease protein n=1 Tax=Antricoccus suffuscus TaxID=1629062 RepID=A0A2T1A6G4_9ACTN|nr:ABC transporter permease [Antricoccus suffuscus]PRZ44189.1 peptide/nickel transport system permease protein [Antricoccus suffuscus]
MLLKVLSRLGIFLMSLFVASVAVFAVMNVLPGNPAQVAAGINADATSVHQLEVKFGLDRPLIVQYFDWVGHLLRGNFGRSYVGDYELTPEIIDKFQYTLYLAIGGTLIALIIAVPLGILMAARNRTASGVGLSVLSQLGISIPAFALGLILISFVSLKWGLLPPGDLVKPGDDFGLFLQQLILPAISLGLVQGAVLSRYVRSAVLDVLRQDYIRTARAKGLTPYRAIVRHGLRNASIPVVTVLGLQLSTLLIGAVVIERVFVISGLGSMLLDKVANRDLIAVQSIVMLLVAATLIITLIVDILYVVIDPRLRASR